MLCSGNLRIDEVDQQVLQIKGLAGVMILVEVEAPAPVTE